MFRKSYADLTRLGKYKRLKTSAKKACQVAGDSVTNNVELQPSVDNPVSCEVADVFDNSSELQPNVDNPVDVLDNCLEFETNFDKLDHAYSEVIFQLFN